MNYIELQDQIARLLMRGDLLPVIPTFITLAESAMNRELRVRQMITRATTPLQDQHIRLPNDWLETRQVELYGDNQRTLRYATLDQADAIRFSGGEFPWAYTIVGGEIEVIPALADGTMIEMVYYAKAPALSDASPTNWLIEDWPDAYLYGSLIHSAPYLKEDERLVIWERMYAQVIEQIRLADNRAQWSGSPLVIRTTTSFGA